MQTDFLPTETVPFDETHLDAQCINKKSSSERCYYVRVEQAEQTDLLKYFAKDWTQY